MVTRDELGFTDSGEPLQEKSVKSSQLRPSLDAPLHREDPEDEALHLDTLVKLMVVASRRSRYELWRGAAAWWRS
jgi:hypothetical protein